MMGNRVQRVAQAFAELQPTKPERLAIQALLDNPGATSETLSRAAGWKKVYFNRMFGGLCKKREHLLWSAEPAGNRPGPFYSGILAHFDDATRGFTMRPEALAGLKQIGLRPRP